MNNTLTEAAVADAVRYFDSWLAFRQRYERLPGVQASVLHGDRIVLSTAHGLADVEAATPLTTAHLFRIASHSKTFTATAIMQLVEAGSLRLDDRAAQFLAFLEGSALQHVTIRELLAHGGGLVRDGADGDFWQLARSFPDAAELQRISNDRANVIDRNTRFKYSNIGYSLLGQIIEAVKGVTYARHVTASVVDRLGLADTGPEWVATRSAEYAGGYSSRAYGDRRIPIDHVDTAAMASATGFFSTSDDVVRYLSAHFHGDPRLLSDESKHLMQRTEWKVEGTDSEYGLGFAIVEIGGRRMLGHGGGYPGHITRSLFDPVAKLAVSVLTNAIDGPAQAMSNAAVKLIDLAADGVPAADASSGVDLSLYCGRFAGLWGVIDIVALGGRLYQLDPVGPDPTIEPTRLEVIDADTVRIAGTSGYASYGEHVRYDRDPNGRIRSIRGGSGSTLYPLDEIEAAATTRVRITLGDPLRPSVAEDPTIDDHRKTS